MFFLVEGLSLKTYFNSGFMFHDVAYTLSNIFPLTCVMLITMMGSLMLHDCRRKETRITVIMLPARQSEKYLSRITVCLFGIAEGTFRPSSDPMEEIESGWYTRAQVRALHETDLFGSWALAYSWMFANGCLPEV